MLRATLLAGCIALAFRAGAAAEDEPWYLEGESLVGSKRGGTEIVAPKIRHGSLEIAARRGRLDADRDVLFLYDSVEIADSGRVVTGAEGVYRRSTRRLDLSGNVRGRGPEGEFRADRLFYDRPRGWLELRGDPEMSDSSRTISADRIDYDEKRALADARGDVRMLLHEDSTWAFAREARYFRDEGLIWLYGDPEVRRRGLGGESDLVVRADTLKLYEAGREGEGFGHVHIARGGVEARSERASFQLSRDRLLLWGNPVAWDGTGEVRADTMSVGLADHRPDLLRAFGHVQVHYAPVERVDESNLVLGDTLVAHLSDDTLTDLEVTGDAISFYLPSLADARSGSGRNLSRARKIVVALGSGQARTVDLITNASGTYYYPSERALRLLRDPSRLDSLRAAADSAGPVPPPVPPNTRDHTTGAPPASPHTSGADTRGAAPELSPLLQHFARTRGMDIPDSLRTPIDALFDEQVEYAGDTIRFYVRDERIHLRGHGRIAYRESALESEDIQFYAARDLVVAHGAPVLKEGESEVKGERMTYRTDERSGFVYQGRTAFEGGFYRGDEIKKLPDNALLVRNGEYTTCDAEPPHFDFRSRKMKLIQNDKVVSRPVVMRILGIPVLALPYYFVPIKKGRHSGLLLPDVEFGFSQTGGRFVNNLGYYWAMNDYMDAKAWADYKENGNQLYLNADYRYRLRYLLDGGVDASYSLQRPSDGVRKRGYSVQGTHQQTLGESAQLTARADFRSDLTYVGERDFGAGVDERLNRTLKSNLEARKKWSTAQLNFRAARTEYLDETTGEGVRVTQDLPALDLTFNQRALGRAADANRKGGRRTVLAGTTVSTGGRFRSTYTKKWSGDVTENSAYVQNAGLSESRKFGSYFRINEGVSGSGGWFRKDALDQPHQFGASWSANAGAGTAVHGTLLRESGLLAGVRHDVEPSASYSYAPEIRSLSYTDSAGRTLQRFPSVGGLGLSGRKASSLGLSLSQRFHAKFRRGETTIKKDNVLTWSTGTSYNFLAERPARPWSAIRNDFRFRPGGPVETGASVTHHPYRKTPDSFSLNSSMTLHPSLFALGGTDSTQAPGLRYGEFGESGLEGTEIDRTDRGRTRTNADTPWTIALAHSYSTVRGAARPTHTLSANLGAWNPTTHWTIEGGVYFDLRAKEVISHSFVLRRDLHCWEFRLDYRSYAGSSEYAFRIHAKELPEVQYERQRR